MLEQVPMLSRGKHRIPRKGACFMELASYLAGERWSDHPACTRPLLAIVTAERQRTLAVAVLTCERLLDDLDGRPPGSLADATRAVLEQVPHAAAWASRFGRGHRSSPKGFRRHAAPSIVAVAVKGIAEACVPDPAQLLYDLLVATSECRDWVDRDRASVGEPDPVKWGEARALTGAAASR